VQAKRPVLTSDQPANVRKIMASLNKLTERNYHAVSTSIFNACAGGQPPTCVVLGLILEQAAKQSCYAEAFVRLAKELVHADLGLPLDADVMSTLSSFCNEFLQGEYLSRQRELASLMGNVGTSAQYDAFCEHMKGKARLLGKGRTILFLILHDVAGPVTGSDYVGSILKVMDSILSEDPAGKMTPSKSTEVLLDIMFDLVLDFRMLTERFGGSTTCNNHSTPPSASGLFRERLPPWDAQLSQVFYELLRDMQVPRLRFKLMDILRM
jgi:hypothetical protein